MRVRPMCGPDTSCQLIRDAVGLGMRFRFHRELYISTYYIAVRFYATPPPRYHSQTKNCPPQKKGHTRTFSCGAPELYIRV